EPVLMAKKLQDVPIVKCADRYKGGVFALRSLPLALCPDLFILDDGFQHLGLFRDKDILLIDGMNPFGNRRLLPLGPLRETLCAIRRAGIIVITKTDEVRSQGSGVRSQESRFKIQDSRLDGLIEEIKRYNSKASIFFAERSPSKFITTTGGTLPLEWAKEKRFFGFCGIGNPESFGRTLLSAGLKLTGVKTYRDHYRYNSKNIETIIKNAKKGSADWIVTTEKDIMRLKGMDIPTNLVALAIEFSVDEGFYEEVFT
ncbi:MAG: tetraacyldisaccharide 4'-kinase, partial [Nitrospirota bacterium]